MRRLTTILAALLVSGACMGVVTSPALAAFGLDDFEVTFSEDKDNTSLATQAGSHPFQMTTSLRVNSTTILEGGACTAPECEVPDEEVRDLFVDLPKGFIGNPLATERCSSEDFAKLDNELLIPSCPDDSAVGIAGVKAEFDPFPSNKDVLFYFPVYNLQPPPGVAAKFGLIVLGVPVTIESGVNEAPPYTLKASLTSVSQALLFYGSELTLWGNPADPAHDPYRGSCLDAKVLGGIVSRGNCPYTSPTKVPFITLPRSCQGPLLTEFETDSWQNPGAFVKGSALTQEMEGCEKLGFDPQIATAATNPAAESPSGLDFDLNVDDPGLLEAGKNADSDIEKVIATLPEGVSTNPSIASGLSACSLAQYEAEAVKFDPAKGCPDAAKVGTVEVTTPLLDETLPGSIYVARQNENPFNSLLALYIVIRSEKLGVVVRQPIKVEPNPATGQLTATVTDIPQLPFSNFHMHFRQGPRAPLITPPTCGKYTVESDLYPYANPGVPVHRSAELSVSSGAGGGACPAQLPNNPSFSAGTLSSKAGTYSPFVFKLSREDGSQRLASVSATLPQGLLGKLAGIPYCSEAQIAQAASRSGQGQGALELAQPSCPLASKLGTVTAGAGAGPTPYYVGGNAYLAGPYKGAPLSLAIISPAIAGPFDLGVVTVRTALNVDSNTSQVTATSDPIPQILHGLPLDVRSIALELNRPSFTLNPTGCEPKSILGAATSTLGQSAALSQYFQASDCGRLGYKPKLSLTLKGGTKRGDHPAFKAVLTPRPGDANSSRVAVTLPHSAFLEQSHIRTVCTRVQFAANSCPPGSIYGKAKAFSPLVDQPFTGPVYLRSSSNPLPDLVLAVHGIFDFNAVGRIDSINARIRNTFDFVPDAPISKVVLEMQGGKKGLIVNSRNLCTHPSKAIARYTAWNAKGYEVTPQVVASSCKGKAKKHKRGR